MLHIDGLLAAYQQIYTPGDNVDDARVRHAQWCDLADIVSARLTDGLARATPEDRLQFQVFVNSYKAILAYFKQTDPISEPVGSGNAGASGAVAPATINNGHPRRDSRESSGSGGGDHDGDDDRDQPKGPIPIPTCLEVHQDILNGWPRKMAPEEFVEQYGMCTPPLFLIKCILI